MSKKYSPTTKRARDLTREFDKVRVDGELSDKLHLRRNYGKPLQPNAFHTGITLCLSEDRRLKALSREDNPNGFDPANDWTTICPGCWSAYQRMALQDMGRTGAVNDKGRLTF